MAGFDWNDLRAFLAVVRTGRLTVAAAQMGVNHSTLSRRIAALERALKTRLFERHPTGYVLTEAGRGLTEQAEEAERLMFRIGSHAAAREAEVTGQIRVATPEGFGTRFLAHRLPELAALYPALTLELIANPFGVSLTKREADIAVAMSPPASGPLRARKLADYELGLYGQAAYLETRPHLGTLADTRGHRIVGYIPGLLPTRHHDYLKEVFGERRADVFIGNVLTQMEATAAGAGLCILPCYMAASRPELVRVLSAEVRIIRSYWTVVHAEGRAPALTAIVARFLLDAVRRHRASFLPGEL